MTQYLLSMFYRQTSADDVPDDLPQIMERVEALNAELVAADAWVFAAGLGPITDATVVTAPAVPGGDSPEAATDSAGAGEGPLVTDGPYLETHEAMGGFWVIEAPDADTAHAWAGKASVALGIPVEVRPVQG